ncbi:hypothetical protein [Streptomyces sp. NPDC029674]|uniref:hypothetical protein n=1 Tax=Streptomyces sp. NPDC029674 TaxID=3365297 RepID=UPI00384CA323
MPAIRRVPAFAAVLAGAGMVLAASSSPAWADIDPGGGESETQVDADTDQQTVSTVAGGIVYDRSKNGKGGNAGPVTPVTNWTPPACYYAPAYSPAQLKKKLEPIWAVDSTGPEWDLSQRNRYVNGKPYKDFNKKKAGKGYWWDSFIPEGRESAPGAFDCDKPYFWVDEGDPPPTDIPEAVTPELLAHLAYAEIRVPDTEVTLAPEEATKVNLPTWAWLDKAEFKPVSVTASVPILKIHATATAEPVSLKIDPGTPDAETYPASGTCEIVDDKIGAPYAKGKAKETPPCGVKYLRSSGDGSYPLKATVTWKIHWTGTGVDGERGLPDGEFGAEQDVVVEEVQSINR